MDLDPGPQEYIDLDPSPQEIGRRASRREARSSLCESIQQAFSPELFYAVYRCFTSSVDPLCREQQGVRSGCSSVGAKQRSPYTYIESSGAVRISFLRPR